MNILRGLSGRLTPTLIVLISALGAGCTPGDQLAAQTNGAPTASSNTAMPATSYNTQISIAEIMDSIIMREADVIWNSVQFESTADGLVSVGPQTDEDWDNLRNAAVTLAESTNNLLIPGRHANRPDAVVNEGELTPAEIDALIESQHGAWTAFADALRASAEQTEEAIEIRDLDRILDVGGTIDEACESCHLVFWYPNQ